MCWPFASGCLRTSPITPAIRANDTSCIWLHGTQAGYTSQPSRAFRSAIIDEAIGANANGLIAPGQPLVNLGLYSITFNNDVALDHGAMSAFRDFREETWKKGFRYFLEVFPPNAPANPIKDVPALC